MTEMAGAPAMPAVAAKDIVVSFDEAQILNAASLEVTTGEIHALIGPNGAGKTTLANVLTGHVRPSSGSVRLFGEELEGATWRRSRKGLGRKFQIPRVFPRLTSEENLMLAASRASSSPSSEGQSSLDISEIRSIRGEALSHGWRQRLEMVMVESQGPRVAVLDEPTAGMTRAERGELAEMIVRHRGRVTYLIVEHDMDFVQTVADRVSFMHEGRVTATGTFAEIQANPTVRQIYLGEGGLDDDGQAEAAEQRNVVREPVDLPEAPPETTEDDAGRDGAGVALLVEEFTVYRGPLPAVREVSFEVAVAGSLGILGRNGAGKSTLLGGLTGVLPSRGRVSLHGEDMTHAPAWRRARAGVALVPQGRQLLPNLSVEENLRLAQLEPSGAGPEFDIHELFPAIGGLLKRRAGLLSGGEQQQVAVARALLRRPTVLLLDEPTEGLAPIIIAEITEVLQHLAARGLTLVLAEQHSHIVEALCEHFLVLRSGEMAGYARTDAGAIASYYQTL